LFGHIDRPAAALPDGLQEFVPTNAVPGFLCHRPHCKGFPRDLDGGDLLTRVGHGHRRLLEEGAERFELLQQGLQALAQLPVAATRAIKEGRALLPC
jgi:hypothetical protein